MQTMNVLFSIFVMLGAVAGVLGMGLLVIGAICVAQLDSDRWGRDSVMAHTLAPALTRLTANIGVEVHGLDLGRGLDDQVLGLLRTAVAEHHMVVLRDQHLSADQHAAVAIAFGPILPSPVQMATGARTVTVSTIEDTASRPPAGFPWHTDLSWTARPPAFGFLSAVTIPEFGGDTIWASTAATFDALPPDAREQCERSTLLHAPDPSLLASVERHHGTKVAERLRRDHPGVEHPLVTTHPITGRRSLFLSPLYARRIVGPLGMRRPCVERAELDARRPACPGAVEVVRGRFRDLGRDVDLPPGADGPSPPTARHATVRHRSAVTLQRCSGEVGHRRPRDAERRIRGAHQADDERTGCSNHGVARTPERVVRSAQAGRAELDCPLE